MKNSNFRIIARELYGDSTSLSTKISNSNCWRLFMLNALLVKEKTNEYETNEFISCTRSTTVHLRMLQMLAIRFNQSVGRSVVRLGCCCVRRAFSLERDGQRWRAPPTSAWASEWGDCGSSEKKHSMNWEQYGNERRVRATKTFESHEQHTLTAQYVARLCVCARMYAIIIKTQWQKFNAVNVHSMVT